MRKRNRSLPGSSILLAVLLFCSWHARADSSLESGWLNAPIDARMKVYWWWINGNVTQQSITRDLEAMKAKGIGGAIIVDADGSSQDGNARVPHGATFFSPAWRELYKHALHEADRLGLQMSLNIQSGWNLGGPMVTAEDAPKKLVWSQTLVGIAGANRDFAASVAKVEGVCRFRRHGHRHATA